MLLVFALAVGECPRQARRSFWGETCRERGAPCAHGLSAGLARSGGRGDREVL